MIKKLKKNEVFVFGANLAGNHCGGAALQALKFGATLGVGEGLTGQCYAFPTLNKDFSKRTISQLKASVKKFYKCARENTDKTFLLTKVGCGIAGFDESTIKELFLNAPDNVELPEDWQIRLWKTLVYTDDKKIKSYNGDCEWIVGEWKQEKEIDMCNKGFHASEKPLDAFGYVTPDDIVALVEVRGQSEIQYDKQVWERMRIIDKWHWTKKQSIALSIYSAELVLKNFEDKYPDDMRPRKAIEAAKKVLKNDTEKNRSAAESARSAAANAAWSARSAANAARSAWSARSAAESAAWSAAESAANAARSAWSARSAAESAAWSAAVSAESAAVSARKDIIKKINDKIIELLK